MFLEAKSLYTQPEDGLVHGKRDWFSVMIKASSGGGGKGMRISRSEEDFTEAF